ncbi:MAG: hypothetical protein WA941_07670 [Nitrososphaeraceae archaeon]
MNTKSLAVVAIAAVAAMLVASVVGTNTVFAGGYEKNQATSQANACGNGKLPLNIGCQNVGSQIQGDENTVAAAADQAFD